MYRVAIDHDLTGPSADYSSGTEVWRDHEGRICAYGGQEGEHYWLRFPGMACFRFHPQLEVATCRREGTTAEAIIEDLFRRTVVPLIYQVGGRAVLHGSAVRSREGVIVFCARSHTGKSTLASAFHLQGFSFWADDAVVVEPQAEGMHAVGLPSRLRLRPPSRRHFQEAIDPTDVALNPDPSAAQGERLLAICLLQRAEGEPGQPPAWVTQVPPSQAMLQLLEHAYSFTLGPLTQRRAILAQYHELATSVPVWDVHVQTGLELLPLAVAALAAQLNLTPVREPTVQGSGPGASAPRLTAHA